MLAIADSAISAASAVFACAGLTLESGLQAGPCQCCLRRSQYALIGPPFPPAVQWVETENLVGYRCANLVKAPPAMKTP